MTRLLTLLAVALSMVAVAGTPVFAQETNRDATYRGFVTDVSRSAKVVTVEKMVSGSPGPARGEFAVDGQTKILRERDGEMAGASFEDLAVAQLVEVSYSGSGGGSEPLETVAGEIVIKSGPLGGVPSNSQNQYSAAPDDPGLQGQYADAPDDGGDPEPAVKDLPDTGGAPLAVLAAAAIVVSGGLLLRRAGR